MLEEQWRYHNKAGLTQWYGRVVRHNDLIVGQWFVLNANDGSELWSHSFHRANSIVGISAGTIVAEEMRSDGPWTASFGIYGIDLRTGRMRWVNHGNGIRGKLWRCLDWVPMFTNEFRDVVAAIHDDGVLTESGRLLDITTGMQQSNASLPPTGESPEGLTISEQPVNEQLSEAGITINGDGPDCVLSTKTESSSWQFSAREQGVHVSQRDAIVYHDYLYVMLSLGPPFVPVRKSQPTIVRENPIVYHLARIDLKTGEWQRTPLWDGEKVTACRIESIQAGQLLVSANNTRLAAFALMDAEAHIAAGGRE